MPELPSARRRVTCYPAAHSTVCLFSHPLYDQFQRTATTATSQFMVNPIHRHGNWVCILSPPAGPRVGTQARERSTPLAMLWLPFLVAENVLCTRYSVHRSTPFSSSFSQLWSSLVPLCLPFLAIDFFPGIVAFGLSQPVGKKGRCN